MDRRNMLRGTGWIALTILGVWAATAAGAPVLRLVNLAPHCPANAVFGQDPHTPDESWSTFTSARTATADWLIFEDYTGPATQATGFRWFGVATPATGVWTPCDPTGMTFEIIVYGPSGGLPGMPICGYEVSPLITNTNVLYDGNPLYEFYAPDVAACPLESQLWISIQSLPNAADCVFRWMTSPEGDMRMAHRYGVGTPPTLTAVDLSLCVMTGQSGSQGACCLANSTCLPGLNEDTCTAQNGIWQGEGTVCDPYPCPLCTPDYIVVAPGSWTGTTCGAGNDCALRPSADHIYEVTLPQAGDWHFELCGATWDTYMYVGTTCCGAEVGEDDNSCGLRSRVIAALPAGVYYVDIEAYASAACGEYPLVVYMEPPCVVTCPEGAALEPEPCGQDLDGGCVTEPHVFAPIGAGETICGTYWSSAGGHDTDWYEFTTNQTMDYFWTVRGTAPTSVYFIDGNAGCPVSQFSLASGDECTDVTVSRICVDPGTYWFVACISEFTDHPCDQTYVATLTASPTWCLTGACCFVDGRCWQMMEDRCAARGGTYQGHETYCEQISCPPCTPDFVVTAPGTWAGNTCGAGNACPLRASQDQIWQVTILEAGLWYFELCGASFDTYLYVGTTCCGQEVGSDDDGCGSASRLGAVLEPGVYYVTVEAWSSAACGAYPLSIYYVYTDSCIPECPIGTVPEGEPLCGPEYIDNYNGGCGSDPVVFQSIADGQTYCSESGTYTFGSSQYRDTDWYVITVDAPQSVFRWDVMADFPVTFGMLEQDVPGLAGCENMTGYLNPYASVQRCTEAAIVSECMPAGTYYFWVGPSVFTDVNCGTRYLATMTVTPGTCPTGACCLQTGQCVPEQLEDQCAELLGLWLGDGTACDPNPCVPFPCVAGSLTCDEYIGDVIVGDFSNPSDCGEGGYTDFTNLCIEMRIGLSYDITVENPVPYGGDQCGIWIDWNHDIGFDTVTEYIAMTGSPGGGPYTATITPPDNAVIGDTVMRIRIMYTGMLHPCGVTQYGEVEDYCVTVLPPLCGDFNADDLVNADDYYLFLDAFGACTGDPKFRPAADSNGNGCIDLVDYQWWMQCYAAANDGATFAPPARRPAAPRPAGPHAPTD